MPHQPRFSIVSAVHDVAAYLPEFIASVDEQDFDLGRVEVIVVDDGSRDGSGDLLRAWAQRRPELVRVISQENAGQAAARNAGLAVATGEWVTFPDPDDVLGKKYLRSVDRFLTSNPTTDMVATERVIWNESTGARTRTHPLRLFFRGNPLVDLADSPMSFHNSAAAAFFSLDRVRELGLAFETELRPNFEDGHFVGRYLLSRERPQVGFLRRAVYNYRKREDGSSTLQTSLMHPGRYTTVFERGYASLVATAQEQRGGIPRWLGSLIGYELATYLIAIESPVSRFLPEGPETEALHANIGALLEHPEIRTSLLQVQYPITSTARLALLHGYDATPWADDHVLLDRADERTGLVRARYYFVGDPPAERVFVGGRVTEPAYAKTRDLRYLGRVLLRERVLWVSPAPSLEIEVDGRYRHLTATRPGFEHTTIGERWVEQNLSPTGGTVEPAPPSPEVRRARRASTRPRAVREFANAWVLLDKLHEGNDNAEHLFAHLRRHHPEINAYFVVAKGGDTWNRLRRAGHGRRLVAHGTLRWQALMAHCTELLSSHCEIAVFAPPEILAFTQPRWRFTFLQHGVTKDDMAHWFGRRPIDVLVTTTAAEHASIAGDGTSYPFTEKEVQQTGMPRLDALLAAARDAADPDVLLVAPTWRAWLAEPLVQGEQRRVLNADAADSEFVTAWRDLLTSPELGATARAHGVRVVVLPHPNVETLFADLALPDHVEVVTYGTSDLQSLFSRTRLLVTDYSSVAFDLAYVDRPVVYFQFDAELVRNGAHSTARGYFAYDRDGFGPVSEDHASTLTRIAEALASPATAEDPYRARAAAAFGARDGGCCERVVQALLPTAKGAAS